MKRQAIRFLLCALIAVMILAPGAAHADDWEVETNGGYFTIHGPDGDVLTRYSGLVSVGDEYIAGDNRQYRVDSVNEGARTATAALIGNAVMPSLSLLSTGTQNNDDENKLIVMYVTHSDESYIPSDGTESKKNNGGIYDVAAAFKKELEENGAQVELDETNHYPHDAGAYRRSRQTAARLMKEGPVAMLDIHRDGVPAEEYEKEINGEQASMVRLLVGRNNQNREANMEFAKQIKAVADEKYPGLIKDIYMGKNNYNQELMPQAILVEFGTHEIEKERAIASTQFMADVMTTTLFGTQTDNSNNSTATKAPSSSAAPNASVAPSATGGTTQTTPGTNAAQTPNVAQQGTREPLANGNSGTMTGILIVLGVLVVGGGIFIAFSRGNASAGQKVRGFTSELTGGVVGNRRNQSAEEKDPEEHNDKDGEDGPE